MKILVTGGTGFVGSKLVASLFKLGHELIVVTRCREKAKKKLPLPLVFLEGDLSKSPLSDVPQVDAVINLAGENIGEGSWTQREKKKIKDSRALLAENLIKSLSLENIKVFIQASAIGYYRESDGDEWLDETTGHGDHFLSKVCQAWELPAKSLTKSIRVVIPRIGVVLGSDGALMGKLIPLYRKGLGGVLGSGSQWMSWIHVDDLVNFFGQALEDESYSGAINLTAPKPVQNKQLNKVLAKYCQRPAIFWVPKFILNLGMGEKSYLALSNQRLSSKLGKKIPFNFKYPEIDSAMREICGFEKLYGESSECFHYKIERLLYIPSTRNSAFEFFARPNNLEKISSKSLNIKLVQISDNRLKEGTTFGFKVKKFGLGLTVKSKVIKLIEAECFIDDQVSGPFETWSHRHEFVDAGTGCIALDKVKYRLPFKFLADLVSIKAQSQVVEMFDQRVEDISNHFKDKNEINSLA